LSILALSLVLLAALAHAGWNYLAKIAGGGALFVWLYASLSALVTAPLAAVTLLLSSRIETTALALMAVSGALHACYFVLLQRGYAHGDLSLVYPLARGTGPLLSVAVAILLLDERPSAVGLAGGGVIVAAILWLAVGSSHLAGVGRQAAVAYALGTGVFIAAYTLWDKHAVSSAGVPPLIYLFGLSLTDALLLTPLALRQPSAARSAWRANRSGALWVAILSSAAYLLVLYALVLAPVSYVAPAREVSILIGVILGTQTLGEGDTRHRLACAAAIMAGIALLGIG
jgi:drug/metabolite transporter (DMT)-like permease